MLVIGQRYYIRTVTDHWIGTVIATEGPYIVTLEDFAWVADSGRFALFLRDGMSPQMEIELAPKGRTYTTQWIGYTEWPFPVPPQTPGL